MEENTIVTAEEANSITSTAQTRSAAPQSLESIIIDRVREYLKGAHFTAPELMRDDYKLCGEVRDELINEINAYIDLGNAMRAKNQQMRHLSSLPGYVCGRILTATGAVRCVRLDAEGEYTIAAKRYDRDGHWLGTYEIVGEKDSTSILARCFHALSPDATQRDLASFRRQLHEAPHCDIYPDSKLVYFANGVFNYTDKSLTSYDSPMYDMRYGSSVSLVSLPVCHPYGPGAALKPDANGTVAEPFYTNPDGTTWKPSDAFTTPFDVSTPEGAASCRIIQQLMQFTIRRENGAPCLYHFWINGGGKGHNGKSTLSDMMVRLVGEKRTIQASIAELGDSYVLGKNVLNAYMILGEENKSDRPIENTGIFKMLSRGQSVRYREIYEGCFSYAFRGALIQQGNAAPRFTEKNDSIISHTCVIRFERSFDDSRPYIKDDYVRRAETAEWLAWYLTCAMPCLDRYDPDDLATLANNSREMLKESTPTFQAMDDIIPGLRMNFIPLEILYDLYTRWCDANGVPAHAIISQRAFSKDLQQYGISNPCGVEYVGRPARISRKDLGQKHPSLLAYGNTRQHGQSAYVNRKALSYLSSPSYPNFASVLDTDACGRTFHRGGLVRTVRWQDAPATPEQDVAEYD